MSTAVKAASRLSPLLLCLGALIGCDRSQVADPADSSADQLVVGEREAQYLYRTNDGNRKLARRPADIPLPNRGAVIVYDAGEDHSSVDGSGELPVVNFLGAEPGDELEIHELSEAEYRRRATSGFKGGWRSEQVLQRARAVGGRFAADPWLWRIEEAEPPVYLFGTGSLPSDKEFGELSHQVRDAFKRVNKLVLPTDEKIIDSEQTLDEFLEMTRLDEHDSLEQKLSEDEWSQLVELLGPSHTPEDLDRYTPAVAANAVDQELSPDGEVVNILEWAERHDHSVDYLESGMDFVRDVHRALGLEELRNILSNRDRVRVNRLKLARAYRSGTIDTYRELYLSDPAGNHRALKRGFADLNRAWLEQVEEYIDSGGGFIIIEASRLVVGESILEGLRKKGYGVSRVR